MEVQLDVPMASLREAVVTDVCFRCYTAAPAGVDGRSRCNKGSRASLRIDSLYPLFSGIKRCLTAITPGIRSIDIALQTQVWVPK